MLGEPMTRIDPTPDFEARHIGPTQADISGMLEEVGYDSVADLVDATIPESIRMEGDLDLPPVSYTHLTLPTKA